MNELIQKWIEYTEEKFPDKDKPRFRGTDTIGDWIEYIADPRSFNDFIDWLVKNQILSDKMGEYKPVRIIGGEEIVIPNHVRRDNLLLVVEIPQEVEGDFEIYYKEKSLLK